VGDILLFCKSIWYVWLITPPLFFDEDKKIIYTNIRVRGWMQSWLPAKSIHIEPGNYPQILQDKKRDNRSSHYPKNR